MTPIVTFLNVLKQFGLLFTILLHQPMHILKHQTTSKFPPSENSENTMNVITDGKSTFVSGQLR